MYNRPFSLKRASGRGLSRMWYLRNKMVIFAEIEIHRGMNKVFLFLLSVLLVGCRSVLSVGMDEPVVDVTKIPKKIFSGNRDRFHVQGIAVDLKRGYIYFSFTTELLKMDLQGNLIGSVTGLTGHLGCLSLHPEDGRLYGSLEYKNDVIGKGIDDRQEAGRRSAFYVAIFDVDRITRPEMDAEKDGVMTTVFLKEPTEDYYAWVENGGKRVEHRFGCSGIDGTTFAPEFGKRKDGKYLLYVAYGIYDDKTRTDNDYQVILAYDTRGWKGYERVLSQKELHTSGPTEPLYKYFVRTGNTTYGIQNLAYDPASGNCFAAVYSGKKSAYPNYTLFVIDGSRKARREKLQGFDLKEEGEVLSLLPQGRYDVSSDTWGWNFEWGATGLCPLGDGYFYISHNGVSDDKKQNSTVYLYRWTGDKDQPFELVK